MTVEMQAQIRKMALDLLARREHTVHELHYKLASRDYTKDAIEIVIDELINDRLLSDERFTEALINRRFNAGVGPCKIRFELRQKGISDDVADAFLDSLTEQWDELMMQQRVRKFGKAIPTNYNERMKQARFLQNRGFSAESVMRLFR